MQVNKTTLNGVYLIELDTFPDERGSFREGYQKEKLEALGLPAINPVQMNVAENKKGVIRGIHAEPWDKYIHIVSGEVYAVIFDLKEDSKDFGKFEGFKLDQTKALFVPRGMGNSYQALTEPAYYAYLVTDHWRAGISYPAYSVDDPELGLDWPLKRSEWIISAKDLQNPKLSAIISK